MSRVVLAMSGGVDSSVAAHLLLEQGHEVVGVFMRHGEEAVEACKVGAGPSPILPIFQQRPDHKQGCCSASDAADARRIADMLEIPFFALNLKAEFRQIIDYFVEEYTVGRTPNPCVMCNNWIKFGKLFDYADSIGAEFVATGHYAQLRNNENPANENPVPSLCRGIDANKDQSYVLFGIRADLLPRTLLPVGGFRKPEIRQMATELGLRVADKKDSQEICFVTSGKHGDFVRERRAAASDCAVDTAGEIVTTAGETVGTHPGIEQFTIGQRKGLGVAMGEPYFVVRIDPASKQVVIGKQEELGRTSLTADRTNWLADVPEGPFRCEAQIRYNSPAAPATAQRLSNGRLEIDFDEPRNGVAAGQAVVCYQEDRVLGGGWIE